MKRQNFATAAFYDDVRQETSGKMIYIGRYNQAFLVRRFPFTIEKLHIEVLCGTDRKEPDFVSEIWVYMPGADEPIVHQIPSPPDNYAEGIPEDAEILQSIHGFTIADVEVLASGEIRIEIHTKSGQKIPAGRLRIDKVAAPSPRNWHQDSLNAIIGHFHELAKVDDDTFERSSIILLKQIIENTQSNFPSEIKECRIPLAPQKCLVLFTEKLENLADRLELHVDCESFKTLDDLGFVVSFKEELPDPRAFTYTIK